MLAVTAAGCTAGGSPAGRAADAPTASAPPANTAPAQARPDIRLITRPGGPDAAIFGGITAPAVLAGKATSCPVRARAAGQRALLDPTWTDRAGTTYLSRLSIGFDLRTAVGDPFVTLTLNAHGSASRLGLWASAPVWGNDVDGRHTTGWTAAGAHGRPLAIGRPNPRLTLQVWAENPVTAAFYCVSATALNLGTN